MLDGRETTALTVAIVTVDAGADDEITLVRLADITMYRVRHDHCIDDRLDRFGDKRLQWMAFDRHTKTRHFGQHRAMAGNHHANFFCVDGTARGLDPGHRAIFLLNRGYFAVLDYIHPAQVGATSKTPGHGVVSRNPATRLKRGT